MGLRRKKLNKFPTIQAAIYRIKKDTKKKEIIQFLKSKDYKEQNIKKDIKKNSDYVFSLFYCSKKENQPKWRKFFGEIVANNQEEIVKTENISEGFIFLIKKKKSRRFFYAFTGGIGYFALKNFIETNFGIEIILRSIGPTDRALRAIRENNIASNILGQNKYFREVVSFYENENFGKIYRELVATLDKKTLERVGLNKLDFLSNSYCIAKSSFKINKSLTFNEILELIESLHLLRKQPLLTKEINSIKKIKENKDLTNGLYEKLYDYFLNNAKDRYSDFIIAHKDFEKFLTSTKFKLITLKKEHNIENIDLETIFALEELKEEINSKDKFIENLKNIEIISLNNDDFIMTKDSFFNHIITEIKKDKKHYFLINGDWFFITDKFIKDLNVYCKYIIENNYIKHKELFGNERWEKFKKDNEIKYEKEDEFNKKFNGKKNYIVLDKITPENIEPCDILKWDDKNLYLIHVKKGFNQQMRDVCSQIYIAARRICLSTKTFNKDKENYIVKIYEFSKGKTTIQITKNNFCKLFKKKIIFVMAILDTAKKERKIKNVKQFNSNIAKFSLKNLFSEIKSLNVELKITQIEKSNKSSV